MPLWKSYIQILLLLAALFLQEMESFGFNPDELWRTESLISIPKITNLQVECEKKYMAVHMEFTTHFDGTIFSKGTYGQQKCVYVHPGSHVTEANFLIYYDRCSTKPDHQGKFYENTLIIQYGPDVIEAWDEAKKIRCEWHDGYEKPATRTPIQIQDLDVVELDFSGDDVDCWMEIQEGKGPWSHKVTSIVPIGSPLTLVLAIHDLDGQFDMRVKSCRAHDKHKPAIFLTDQDGCVLRPKLMKPFQKTRDTRGHASVMSYSHFYAFKFPESMEVYIQCTVEICRHGCVDTCKKTSHSSLSKVKPHPTDGYDPSLYNDLNQNEEFWVPPTPAPSSEYDGDYEDNIPTYHDTNHDPKSTQSKGRIKIPDAPATIKDVEPNSEDSRSSKANTDILSPSHENNSTQKNSAIIPDLSIPPSPDLPPPRKSLIHIEESFQSAPEDGRPYRIRQRLPPRPPPDYFLNRASHENFQSFGIPRPYWSRNRFRISPEEFEEFYLPSPRSYPPRPNLYPRNVIRTLRLRRNAISGEKGQLGLGQMFQVVASSDMAFDYTEENSFIADIHQQEHDVCISNVHFVSGLSILLLLNICSLCLTSFFFYHYNQKCKKQPKLQSKCDTEKKKQKANSSSSKESN